MKTIVLIGGAALALGAWWYLRQRSSSTSSGSTGASSGDDSIFATIAAKIDAAAAAEKAAAQNILSGGIGGTSTGSDSNQAIGAEVELQALLQQIKNVFSVNGNYGLGGGDPSTQDAPAADARRLGLNLATTTV